MRTKGIRADWNKFEEWERKYTIKNLKKLTPTEKIKILEDLYKTALKVRESLRKMDPK